MAGSLFGIQMPFDLFFLTFAIVFTVYSLDLLMLVIASAIAGARRDGLGPIKSICAAPGSNGKDIPKVDVKNSDSVNSLTDVKAASDKLKEGKEGWAAYCEQYPKVLVQIPMYNEEAMCDIIIERCGKISWPRDRFLIQVLDDSTKEIVRNKVDAAAVLAMEAGIPVQVLRRSNRQGFKAGALVEGLKYTAIEGFQYVAIFDADFEPPLDFLQETIPRLQENPKLGFVQTCWTFTNVNSFLTWAQSVNLGFHFHVEQRSRSYLGWFFNFCGTAGVWRIHTIHDAGGWESDTVVEDMDLSLRAYLKGWNALYVHHVKCPNELPPTLAAYKTQQFRWLSGPMQILMKCFMTIAKSKNVTLSRKITCYWFFFRYVLFGMVSVMVLAVPPYIFFAADWTWSWEQWFFVIAINFALLVYIYITPFSIMYLLFSVAVGYFKTWAMFAGLIGSKKSKSWKVTKKFGAGQKKKREFHKPYLLELILFLYYGGCGGYAFWINSWLMFAYCCVMALSFICLSLGDYLL